ncbi:MAG: non-canonical purine NTP pyrophosphatase [Sulfolobales archaeon]
MDREGGRGIRVLLITGNKYKAIEISQILEDLYPEVFSIEIGSDVKKLEIQSESLEEIAYTSLRSAIEHLDISRWDTIWVEDSGLFIEALGGFPGPYSSYVLRKIGLEGILRLLSGVSDRRACYRAVIAYTLKGSIGVESGELCGSIAYRADGSEGFGYDPIFIPEGYSETLARLGYSVKNRISHRARAVKAVASKILSFHQL